LRGLLTAQQAKKGAGLRILTETITSPTTADLLNTIKTLYPESKWHQWEPAGAHTARAGAMAAFGAPANTYYNLLNANVVVSLDSDFLSSGPGAMRYAREFSARRRVLGDKKTMNRLYAAEPFPTATGSKADHRFPMRAADVETFAFELAAGLGVAGGVASGNAEFARWAAAIARDLQANKGASLVIPGDQQSPAVHALAHAMNDALGNRDVIGQAKGILMERRGITADAAFAVLARVSQAENTKVAEIARRLAQTGELPAAPGPGS